MEGQGTIVQAEAEPGLSWYPHEPPPLPGMRHVGQPLDPGMDF